MNEKKRSWFRRKNKKTKKDEKLSIFGEPMIDDVKEEKTSFTSYVKSGGGFLRQKLSRATSYNKIHIKYLLKIKRGVSGVFCIIYLISAIILLPNTIALLFFVTSYLLLDYLWKTRVVKWVQDDDKQ